MAQLTDDQVANAVAFLARARASEAPLPAFPEDCRPTTIDDAYRIAQATRSPADERPDGWKAGASSPAQVRDAGLATPPSRRCSRACSARVRRTWTGRSTTCA